MFLFRFAYADKNKNGTLDFNEYKLNSGLRLQQKFGTDTEPKIKAKRYLENFVKVNLKNILTLFDINTLFYD